MGQNFPIQVLGNKAPFILNTSDKKKKWSEKASVRRNVLAETLGNASVFWEET